jgi:hypothetical protein
VAHNDSMLALVTDARSLAHGVEIGTDGENFNGFAGKGVRYQFTCRRHTSARNEYSLSVVTDRGNS